MGVCCNFKYSGWEGLTERFHFIKGLREIRKRGSGLLGGWILGRREGLGLTKFGMWAERQGAEWGGGGTAGWEGRLVWGVAGCEDLGLNVSRRGVWWWWWRWR